MNGVSLSGATGVALASPQGAAGPAGTDHGYATYSGGSAAMTLSPALRQQIAFPAVAGGAIVASSPFFGHVFFDGALIRPRKAGDTAIVRLDITSTAFVAGGSIEIQLDIGGALGVIQTVTRALKAPAGQAEHISEAFPVYMGSTFLADGGALYLDASVPTVLTAIGIVIFPLSAAS